MQFELDQNYPNPFNPTTTIRYGFPQRSHVKLEIFTVLGQLVRLLADQYREARYHSVSFNGSSLASRVYFYRTQAANFVQAKKLVLLR